MALIICNGCGKEIDDTLEVCSNCGVAIPKSDKEPKGNKTWYQLTEEERRDIINYRKETKQWWTGLKIIHFIFALLFIPCFVVSFLIESFLLDVFTLLVMGVAVVTLRIEPEIWLKNNYEKLFQMGIVK